MYDLAGQRMYHVLHQIVMTEALTIGVVVVSLEHGLDEMLGWRPTTSCRTR